MANVRSVITALGAGLMILSILGGCSDNTGGHATAPTVAKVGNTCISTGDLRQFIKDRPLSRRDGDVENGVKKRLDELVLEEVLFQEAMAQKLDQDPEIQKALRQLLISKLMETRVEKPAWEESAAPEKVQAYYEAHRHEFGRPEQIRLADILISVPPGAGDDERKSLRQKSENVHAMAGQAKNRRGGFSKLIQHFSDTPARYDKGDTGFIDREGGPAGIDKRLARAAFDIPKNGGLAPEVIEADDGYHIIMRVAKRSASHIPLEKVEHNLVQRIRKERLETERTRYLNAVREKSDIQVNAKKLAEIIQEAEKMRHSADKLEKNRLARSGKGNAPPVFRGE